jgi:hypothetical protein
MMNGRGVYNQQLIYAGRNLIKIWIASEKATRAFASNNNQGRRDQRMDPIRVIEFTHEFEETLPDAQALLRSANLIIHPGVSRIILHGSRGLAGGYRPDSDIDLSLIVDQFPLATLPEKELLLHDILETTLMNWHTAIEPDLAVIFDIQNCAMHCFEHTHWEAGICTRGGVDCFGLYKEQKGFHGLVTHAGVEVKRMYPCMKIWQREGCAREEDEE